MKGLHIDLHLHCLFCFLGLDPTLVLATCHIVVNLMFFCRSRVDLATYKQETRGRNLGTNKNEMKYHFRVPS